MARGVRGSGPYGEIREIREWIRELKAEIRLIESGEKRPLPKETVQKIIAIKRAEIRVILSEIAKNQPSSR